MSSHNFISLYFSLELHSLSLISLMFVITFVMVQSYRSNSLDPISYSLSIISLNLVEAALKYFWLSIILSYAILIGIATCYAFTGQTDISKVKIRIIEILVFLIFSVSSITFKDLNRLDCWMSFIFIYLIKILGLKGYLL